MIKLFNLMLIFTLYGFAVHSEAQTCRSDSEIPASTPTSQFSDHGDGTLTDTKTGLMWAKCSEGQFGSDCVTGSATTHNWQEALNLASASNLAGYGDWRLPNRNELDSIIERQCFIPAINLSVFPGAPAWHFWSASPYDASSWHSTWYVDFYHGWSVGNGYRGYSLHVRLVRGRQ